MTLPADVRLWLAHAYLALAYWTPALLVPAECRSGVTAFDARLARLHERVDVPALPASIVPALELAYLLCYLVVPTAFVFVWANGDIADGDDFWIAVLLSGFLCYGSLPWLISRPPRLRNAATTAGIRRANEWFLGRLSHGLNTFPSGHVAVSIAAALEVTPLVPSAGIALTVVAAAIAAGAVAGRYHYSVDVLLGASVGTTVSLSL